MRQPTTVTGVLGEPWRPSACVIGTDVCVIVGDMAYNYRPVLRAETPGQARAVLERWRQECQGRPERAAILVAERI